MLAMRTFVLRTFALCTAGLLYMFPVMNKARDDFTKSSATRIPPKTGAPIQSGGLGQASTSAKAHTPRASTLDAAVAHEIEARTKNGTYMEDQLYLY